MAEFTTEELQQIEAVNPTLQAAGFAAKMGSLGSGESIGSGELDAADLSIANNKILIGQGTGLAEAKSVTGAVVMVNTGVTTLSAGVVFDANINTGAAITRSKLAQNDLSPFAIPFAIIRAADGNVLGIADTLDSGDHYLSISGNVWKLMGNSPASNTQTDISYFQFQLPESYVSGETITIRLSAKATATGDTQTLDLEVYGSDAHGVIGADVNASAIKTLTTSNAYYDFTITPTGFDPGEQLNVKLTTVFQDADGAVGEIQINKITVQLDIKG